MTDRTVNGLAATWTQTLSDQDTSRIADINMAWRAYKGTLEPALVVRPRRPDDNVAVNYCRSTVDKGVAFLFGEEVTFSLDRDQTQKTPQEEWLERVWQANRKKILLQRLAVNGAIAGHAFLKIMPGDPYPKLTVLDPLNVRVVTQEDDFTIVIRYIIQWWGQYLNPLTNKSERAIFRQIIERSDQFPSAPIEDVALAAYELEEPLPPVTDGDTEYHWRIIDQVTTETSVQYVRGSQSIDWVTLGIEIWPFTFAPIVDCQNLPNPNAFWGIPDLTPDLIQLQRNLNRALSNINKILRLHAHPKTWTRGLSDTQLRNLQIDPEGVINLPSPDAELHNLEMTSDLGSSLQYYQQLRDAFHELAMVPEIQSDRLDAIGTLSGVALRILYGPLIQKTEVKHLLYGELVQETCLRLLRIQYGDVEVITIPDTGEQQTVPMAWDIHLDWPEIVPQDPKEEAEIALLDHQLGVSKQTLMRKRGYDPDKEKEFREAENQEALEQAQQMFAAQSRGQAGTDPFGRDRNNTLGGSNRGTPATGTTRGSDSDS